MKKWMIVALIGAFVLGTVGLAVADKVRTIDRTRVIEIKIRVAWDNTLTNIVDADVSARGITLDTTGARAGDVSNTWKYNDLPTNPKNGVKYIIETAGLALSNIGDGNAVTPTVPATMPGQ